MTSYFIVVNDGYGKDRWYRDEAESESALEAFAVRELPAIKTIGWADRRPYGTRPVERVLQITIGPVSSDTVSAESEERKVK